MSLSNIERLSKVLCFCAQVYKKALIMSNIIEADTDRILGQFYSEIHQLNFPRLKHNNVNHIDMTCIFIQWLKHNHPNIINYNILAQNLVSSGFNNFYDYIGDIPTTPLDRNRIIRSFQQ